MRLCKEKSPATDQTAVTRNKPCGQGSLRDSSLSGQHVLAQHCFSWWMDAHVQHTNGLDLVSVLGQWAVVVAAAVLLRLRMSCVVPTAFFN